MAVSRNAMPDAMGDWDIHTVLDLTSFEEVRVQSNELVESLDGNLGWLYQTSSDDNMSVRFLTSSTNSPQAFADWTRRFTKRSPYTTSASNVLAIHGRYLITYNGDDLFAAVSKSSEPVSTTTDWDLHPYSGGSRASDVDLLNWQDRPLLFRTQQPFSDTQYFDGLRCMTALPSFQDDWEFNRFKNNSRLSFPDASLGAVVVYRNTIYWTHPKASPRELIWKTTVRSLVAPNIFCIGHNDITNPSTG